MEDVKSIRYVTLLAWLTVGAEFTPGATMEALAQDDASSAAGVGQPVVGYYYSTSKSLGLPDVQYH